MLNADRTAPVEPLQRGRENGPCEPGHGKKKELKGHVMNQKSSDLRGWSLVRLRPQPVGQYPERQRVIESGSGDIEHAY